MRDGSGLRDQKTTERAPPIDAVIRLPNVISTRDDLEAWLGVPLHRFESSRHGAGHYGQLNTAVEGGWPALVALLERVGPALQDCVNRGVVGRPEIDVGWMMGGGSVASSLRVPQAVTAAIARYGFELVVSVYRAD